MRGRPIIVTLSILLVLIIGVSLVGACSDTTPATTSAPAQTTSSAPAPSEPETIKWRSQCFKSTGYTWETVLPNFVNRIKDASNGRLEIELFPAGALVPTAEILEQTGKGVVEVGMGGPIYWTGKLPACSFADAPMCFDPNLDQMQYVWHDMGLIDVLRDEYAKYNDFLLAIKPASPYGATMSTKPIITLDDFQGVKIRTFGMLGKVLTEFGASVVNVAVGEMYTALATGTIDAAHWSAESQFYDLKIHEVCKNFLYPPMDEAIKTDVMINMDAWEALPDDLKQIVLDAGRISEIEEFSMAQALNKVDKPKLEAAGVTFRTLSDADIAKMRAKSMELLEEASKTDEGSTKAWAIIKEAMQLYEYVD